MFFYCRYHYLLILSIKICWEHHYLLEASTETRCKLLHQNAHIPNELVLNKVLKSMHKLGLRIQTVNHTQVHGPLTSYKLQWQLQVQLPLPSFQQSTTPRWQWHAQVEATTTVQSTLHSPFPPAASKFKSMSQSVTNNNRNECV